MKYLRCLPRYDIGSEMHWQTNLFMKKNSFGHAKKTWYDEQSNKMCRIGVKLVLAGYTLNIPRYIFFKAIRSGSIFFLFPGRRQTFPTWRSMPAYIWEKKLTTLHSVHTCVSPGLPVNPRSVPIPVQLCRFSVLSWAASVAALGQRQSLNGPESERRSKTLFFSPQLEGQFHWKISHKQSLGRRHDDAEVGLLLPLPLQHVSLLLPLLLTLFSPFLCKFHAPNLEETFPLHT